MNPNIIALYQIIREDAQIQAELSGLDTEPYADVIMGYAAKHNLSFSRNEAISAIIECDQLVLSAVNDDELTDFELELVAAGVPLQCGDDGLGG